MRHLRAATAATCLAIALTGCTGDGDGSSELPGQETPSNAVPTVQPDSPSGTVGDPTTSETASG